MGVPTTAFLESVGHHCPRILGSLDDLSEDQLREHFAVSAAAAGVPELMDEQFGIIAEVIKKAGALRGYDIRRSAAVPVEVKTAGGLILERDAKRRATTALVTAVAAWAPPAPG